MRTGLGTLLIFIISMEKYIYRTNNDGDFLYVITVQTGGVVGGSEAGEDLEPGRLGRTLGRRRDLEGSLREEQLKLKQCPGIDPLSMS